MPDADADAVAGNGTLPPFPKPSGIAAGWKHLDLTWPYAILLFGLELIVVVLWIILVRRFVALREAQADVNDPKADTDFDREASAATRTRRGGIVGSAAPSTSNGFDRGWDV